MSVPMVQVRVVGMPVSHGFMAMPVAVRLTWRRVGAVGVLVVIVMAMPVLVLQCVMDVFVGVPFGDMEPKPKTHERPGHGQLHRERLPEDRDGQNGAHEGGHGEIGPGASRPEVAEA